jgi:hypothetical protein
MTQCKVGWLAPVLVTAALGVSGCSGAVGSEEAPPPDPAAKVEVGDGSQPARISLTEAAERRLGMETKPVRLVRGGSGGTPMLVIPYAAVVYDANGDAWAFTSPAPRTYVRAPLVVRSIENNRVTLSSGPRPGTQLVTVGAAELVGAEAGISGEE